MGYKHKEHVEADKFTLLTLISLAVVRNKNPERGAELGLINGTRAIDTNLARIICADGSVKTYSTNREALHRIRNMPARSCTLRLKNDFAPVTFETFK